MTPPAPQSILPSALRNCVSPFTGTCLLQMLWHFCLLHHLLAQKLQIMDQGDTAKKQLSHAADPLWGHHWTPRHMDTKSQGALSKKFLLWGRHASLTKPGYVNLVHVATIYRMLVIYKHLAPAGVGCDLPPRIIFHRMHVIYKHLASNRKVNCSLYDIFFTECM